MQSAANSFAYPRTYRLTAGWMAFMFAFGAAATAGGIAGLWFANKPSTTFSGQMTLLVVCGVFVIFGIYAILSALKSRFVLFADRVEDHGVFSTRELRRDQILGRRYLETTPRTLVLVPRDGARQLKIGLTLRTDDVFREWTESLPDLDAQDFKASQEEIAGGPEGRSTREERMQGLAGGKKLAQKLNIAAWVIAGWAWLYPRPYNLAITLLILMPWLAVTLMARSEGLFHIDQRRNDAHPSLGPMFIMPGLILAVRALNDMHALEWKPALGLSIVVGSLLWIAVVKVDPDLRSRAVSLVILLFITLAYGYGAGMETNALLDRSAPSVYSAHVMHKHVSSGRHTTYDLLLEPWGPQAQSENISVSSSLYRSVTVGDTVCVSLKPGALNIAWFAVHACR
jgi:hypothetical protein